ncbi:hypothetical protein ACYOEI_05910 [Singulisphaera rosea]
MTGHNLGVQVAFGPPATAQDSLVGKLTEAQMTSVITQSESSDKRKHDERLWGMWLTAGIVGATIVLIPFLCLIFLTFQQSAALEKVLNLILGFVAGSAGGFGIGRWTAQKPDAR